MKTGQVLAGKYRVEGVIGAGAMGEVVAAMHLQLKERVAIKLLRPEALLVPHASARFVREARAAVRIKSEHVGRVIDVGVLDDGTPMMVMEYLEGMDLDALLAERGPLPIPLAVDYVLQACEAIAEAHALGIVHRDLKPANLFLIRRADGSPCVKVLDFGISKVTLAEPSASEAAMARTTATMGSPAYMSPEQLHSTADVDARTDIWALGVTLYQLLAAAFPFSGATLVQLYTKIREQPVPSVRAARADVPAALDAAIGRCLQRDLDKRYATVAELAEALAPFGSLSAKISADRIGRIVPGARAASDPSLARSASAAAETAVAVTAAQETIALPTLKKASIPSAVTNIATTAPESWGSTAVEKPAKSRAPLMIGLLGGIGLGVAVVAGILHWKASENAAAPEASAVPLSADSALTASPAPAVSAPLELAESTAAALVSAAPAAADRTVDAGTDPDDPAALKASMLAQAADKAGYVAALGVARRLFELAPKTAGDEDMRRMLLRIANGRTVAAAQALDAMENKMGSFGPDMLFEIANDPSMEKLTRDRAQKLVNSAEVKKLATPALLVVMALKPLSPCAKKALFARAKEEGDARALAYLRPLLVTDGCSKLVVMKTDCYPCLKDRTDLIAAIKAIEERGSKR